MLDALYQQGKEELISKGSYLFRQGDQVENLYIIRAGLVKAYYETYNGKEMIKSFIKEGGAIGSMRAIVNKEPTPFTVLCLEDSVVIGVKYSTLFALVEQNGEFTRGLNTMLLHLAQKKEQREYELLCLSAEERYQNFCQREPDLIRRLSQKDIARYLGITAVALSRIKRRMRSKPGV